jgi:sulfate transport system permease protein
MLLIVAAVVLLAVVVGLPLVVVVTEALRGGFTAFAQLFSTSETTHAIVLTATVALFAVTINAVLGLLLAWTLTKYAYPGKAFLTTLIDLPLSVSPVVAGLSVLLAFGTHSPLGAWMLAHGMKIIFATPGIVLATIFVTFPFIAREVAALMDEQGRQLEEAALSMGASVWTVFWRVTLPNVRWALTNGVILCAARAMGEFGAVNVVSGRIRGQTETVPLYIEALYNDYNVAGAFSMALILVLVTSAAICARIYLSRKHVDRHTKLLSS